MPYYRCCSCHLEFKHTPKNDEYILCEWCGTPTKIIEETKSEEIDHSKNTTEKIKRRACDEY